MAEPPSSSLSALDSDAELEPDVDEDAEGSDMESELGALHSKQSDSGAASSSSVPAPTTCAWGDCTRVCDSLGVLVKVRFAPESF